MAKRLKCHALSKADNVRMSIEFAGHRSRTAAVDQSVPGRVSAQAIKEIDLEAKTGPPTRCAPRHGSLIRHKLMSVMAKRKATPNLDDRVEMAGLPPFAVPWIKLDPGRYRPASGLAGAQRRTDQMLAARSSLVLAPGSRAMSEV